MKFRHIPFRHTTICVFLCSSLLIPLQGMAEASTPEPQMPEPQISKGSRPDFSGVWEMADFDLVRRPETNNPTFTPEAKAKLDYFKKYYDEIKDDPALFCMVKGMPWTITSRARTYPTEIYQTDDQIFMFFEYMDNRRVIHLDKTEMPEFYPRSSEGYSIGHWEDDTLVIKTRGLTAKHDISPYARSEETTIIERWTLVENPKFGTTIDIEVTVHDPNVYAKPAKGHQVFMRAPEGISVGGYNCQYQLWDKHIEKREKEIEQKSALRGDLRGE